MRSLKLLVIVSVVLLAATAIAQSKSSKPNLAHPADETQAAPLDARTPISFHGRLTDSGGNAVTGTSSVTFSLYATQSATTVYWSETHSLTPADGWFSVVLGDTSQGGTQFPADWSGVELWLGITVQGDAEMVPRTPLLPVPYAAIANPTQHAFTHELGGTDELGSQLSTDNELVRSNANGTIDPGWLPLAQGGTPGVVTLNSGSGSTTGVVTGSDSRLSDARTPTAHASTHQLGGSDPVATATPGNNAIPAANGSGKLALGWLPTSTTGASSQLPVGGGSGKLDPSWLQFATSSQTTTGFVVGADDTRLSNARTPTAHAATHAESGSDPIGVATPGSSAKNALPYTNANGYLDNWIQLLPATQGGTGVAAAKLTRNLCFFIAGPSGGANIPTLMVPPGSPICTATTIYASSPAAPTATVTYNMTRVSPTLTTLFSSSSWNAGLGNTGGSGTVIVNAGDVLTPTLSAGVSNATICVQLSCPYSFQ